jgi:hypothetical protein
MRGDHDAELGISTFQVRFMPVGKCNLGSMTIPTKVVRGALRSTGESSTLTLTVPNPKNPAKTIEINLVDAAPTELEVILRVLEMTAKPTPAP